MSLTDVDLARLEKIAATFEKYAPGFQASTPEESAKSVLAAIERSPLDEGYGSLFLSHNGTKSWM